MPNGKPGDHPYTDFFTHKFHVFPEDMAAMLNAIHSVSPRLVEPLGDADMWDWEAGKNLDIGREKLRKIIADNNIPFSD